MIENLTDITIEELLGAATRLKRDGYRLVTLSGIGAEADQVEILYHFDRDLSLVHLRLNASTAVPVPSISPVFLAAFLAENEIQDLFHIRFHGLVVDYQGRLFLSREMATAPLGRRTPETTPAAADGRPAVR